MKLKQITTTDAYSLEIDIEKNRVYFCIYGHWDNTTQLDSFLEDWKRAISHLQSDFTILSDIRTMLPHALAVEKIHEETQKYLIENGLFKVAEVVPINDIAHLQSSRIVERSNLPMNKFDCVEEAERYLDQVVKKLR